MKRKLPPLGALRAFDAVARLQSFKLAAEEIGVSPTAVSHQIRLLESLLEVSVFERTPRKVELTADGKVLQQATAQAFALLQAAAEKIGERQRPRVLTLTATTAMIAHWLVPRLPALMRQFPNIDLRLHADDGIVDLRSRQIDVALRYGAEPGAQLTPRLLYQDSFVLVASPQLTLKTPEDLLQATLIHTDGRRVPQPAPDWYRWRREFGPVALQIDAGPRFTDEAHAIQATIAGQGVAIVSQLMAQHALNTGLLVAPFNMALPGAAHYFVSNPDGQHPQTVAQLADWVAAEMKR
ncbi:LysR family transcriptional regulator [Serratia proteamaculans]|uniref:LysR family transcriptional regulator n=1 Tax=Serratia proteamaculans TaxID=28151 RepID=A0A7U0N5U2_SERPR|nr:LysR substrate-binding domain-containing protein [Serratia proteamaculans]MBO1501712.1 LysR family transcriptional regulator [Serratia proteamaculans]MDW5508444.1 LysR substrate-binding domain-containing protein [Serratia proteamaculans]QQX52903.1 LysR family transcriptional regulator [Serratia proteamaculans]